MKKATTSFFLVISLLFSSFALADENSQKERFSEKAEFEELAAQGDHYLDSPLNFRGEAFFYAAQVVMGVIVQGVFYGVQKNTLVGESYYYTPTGQLTIGVVSAFVGTALGLAVDEVIRRAGVTGCGKARKLTGREKAEIALKVVTDVFLFAVVASGVYGAMYFLSLLPNCSVASPVVAGVNGTTPQVTSVPTGSTEACDQASGIKLLWNGVVILGTKASSFGFRMADGVWRRMRSCFSCTESMRRRETRRLRAELTNQAGGDDVHDEEDQYEPLDDEESKEALDEGAVHGVGEVGVIYQPSLTADDEGKYDNV